MQPVKHVRSTQSTWRSDISRSLGRYITRQVSVRVFYRCSLVTPTVSQVFKKIEKQLPQLTMLDLQYVSPELLKAKNLDLAVPGTLA